jgi:putative FmdB family regulatory protein
MACEHRFEQRRPMGSSIDTGLACPACGDDRVRRQFSFLAGSSSDAFGASAGGGCACGGDCACGG